MQFWNQTLQVQAARFGCLGIFIGQEIYFKSVWNVSPNIWHMWETYSCSVWAVCEVAGEQLENSNHLHMDMELFIWWHPPRGRGARPRALQVTGNVRGGELVRGKIVRANTNASSVWAWQSLLDPHNEVLCRVRSRKREMMLFLTLCSMVF